ncbi:MAG: RdgB/HAM1 family non-canonical purine NTP pyrophosphatase [Bacillota bacterium]|nr:RdgB/HAM1 family non-canonical purine NTP pyrophosphatase [Bacillota bacterium]
MRKLLIATGNAHKIEEIRAILAGCGVFVEELLCLKDIPGYQAPEEDGDSFQANAALKARAAAESSGLPALADDSGLTVEALDGAPGIYSARYAGEAQDDAANRKKLLSAMEQIPAGQRQAAFVCAVALAMPGGECVLREACVPGEIAFSESGAGGFGYDSLFYLPQQGKTMAQLPQAEKNGLSHRALALEMLRDALLVLE